LLFSAHCSAAHMPFIAEQTSDDVAGKVAALQQVRNGAYGQVSGLLQMAGDPTFEADRRHRAIAQLGADAPSFAIILSAAQRQELAGMAATIKETLPDADKAGADKIATALTTAPCEALCRM
jgi:hypothetical protein